MSSPMVKPIPRDNELEEMKRSLRVGIAESKARTQMLTEALEKLEGVKHTETPKKGLYSDLSAIEATVSYLKDRGHPVPKKKLISDLALLGVCYDSKSRGGAAADIKRSVTRFLKYGHKDGEKSVLIPVDGKIALRA